MCTQFKTSHLFAVIDSHGKHHEILREQTWALIITCERESMRSSKGHQVWWTKNQTPCRKRINGAMWTDAKRSNSYITYVIATRIARPFSSSIFKVQLGRYRRPFLITCCRSENYAADITTCSLYRTIRKMEKNEYLTAFALMIAPQLARPMLRLWKTCIIRILTARVTYSAEQRTGQCLRISHEFTVIFYI